MIKEFEKVINKKIINIEHKIEGKIDNYWTITLEDKTKIVFSYENQEGDVELIENKD